MIIHPIDELPAHALGILDPEEQRAVDAHLEICGPCRDEERAFAETTWTVAETSSREAPSRVRGAIVARARHTGPAKPRASSFLAPLLRPVPLAVPLALAAVLVIALVGYGSARRDADRYAVAVSALVGAKVVPLAATGVTPGVRGSLVVPTNGAAPYLLLDLPEAPAGKTWEAWILRGDAPIRAGITDEHGVSTVALAAPLAAGDGVAVTLEPSGGVDRPTGAPVLTGKT